MKILVAVFMVFVLGAVADNNITVKQKELDSAGWGRYVEKSGLDLYFVGDCQYTEDSSIINTSSIKIIKTDSEQNIVWDKNYSSMEHDYHSLDIVTKIKDVGSGLIVTGFYQPNYTTGENLGFIRQFDYNGNEIKKVKITKMDENGNFDNIFIYDIAKTSDGYIAVGGINSASLILKLDSNLNEISRNAYTPSKYSSDIDLLDSYSERIIALNDGYIIGTTIQFNASSQKTSIALVEKFDTNGTLIWSDEFKDTQNDYDKTLKNLLYANGKVYAVIDNFYTMEFKAIDPTSGIVEQSESYSGVHNAIYLDNEGFLLYSAEKMVKIDFSFNTFFENTLTDGVSFIIANLQRVASNKFIAAGYTPYPQKIESIEYDLSAVVLNAGAIITKSYIDSLSPGWHLLGTNLKITDFSLFDNCDYVWQYKDGRWSAFSRDFFDKIANANIEKITNIEQGDAFWVHRK